MASYLCLLLLLGALASVSADCINCGHVQGGYCDVLSNQCTTAGTSDGGFMPTDLGFGNNFGWDDSNQPAKQSFLCPIPAVIKTFLYLPVRIGQLNSLYKCNGGQLQRILKSLGCQDIDRLFAQSNSALQTYILTQISTDSIGSLIASCAPPKQLALLTAVNPPALSAYLARATGGQRVTFLNNVALTSLTSYMASLKGPAQQQLLTALGVQTLISFLTPLTYAQQRLILDALGSATWFAYLGSLSGSDAGALLAAIHSEVIVSNLEALSPSDQVAAMVSYGVPAILSMVSHLDLSDPKLSNLNLPGYFATQSPSVQLEFFNTAPTQLVGYTGILDGNKQLNLLQAFANETLTSIPSVTQAQFYQAYNSTVCRTFLSGHPSPGPFMENVAKGIVAYLKSLNDDGKLAYLNAVTCSHWQSYIALMYSYLSYGTMMDLMNALGAYNVAKFVAGCLQQCMV